MAETLSTQRWKIFARNAAKDCTAGLITSVVLIANIVSFAALMFPSELAAGIPTAIWAMLIGSAVCGAWIAVFTSLQPLATGIDSPTGTVLVLLSASIHGLSLAAGSNPSFIIEHILMAFSAATVITGALLFLVGFFKFGPNFKFVPYFVVGGFLASTGCLLIAGGFRMTTGHLLLPSSLLVDTWTADEGARLLCAVSVLLVLLSLRKWVKSAAAIPLTLLVMCVGSDIVKNYFQLPSSQSQWYLPSLGTLHSWNPLGQSWKVSWPETFRLLPELLAVSIVSLLSIITKVASLEVARECAADLNRELRLHGIGSLIAAPVGGLTSSLAVGTSRLLEQGGGVTRWSGAFCSLLMGLVALTNLDLPSLIPTPVIAGLVFYLGYGLLHDALWKLFLQKSWFDLVLTLISMAICVGFGFLVGVMAGIIAACLLFAINYARLQVVGRHSTRANFESDTIRSPESSKKLRMMGESIQIYWLTGYLFFGSSENLFERIRLDLEAIAIDKVSYLILDFASVSGVDSSGMGSLMKILNYCYKRDVIVLFSSLRSNVKLALLQRGAFHGTHRRYPFSDANQATAWCEDQILKKQEFSADPDHSKFESWLQRQLGQEVKAEKLLNYLEKREIPANERLYRAGEPADSIQFVAAGEFSIDVLTRDGERKNLTRITTHSLIGEMGFFSQARRAGSVVSDGPAVIYELSRDSYVKMRKQNPELVHALHEFIIRMLSDRVRLHGRKFRDTDLIS